MLLVIPVHAGDLPLALLNLRLAAKLDATCPFPALLSAPHGLDITALEALASKWFAAATTYRYHDWSGDKAWPRPQNWAWQSVARHIASLAPAPKCWFWWEADATPLKSGWFNTLLDAYTRGAKPFCGQLLGMNPQGRFQTTGVALYPADVRRYSTNSFLARANPFDCVLKGDIERQCSSLSGVVAHYYKPAGRPAAPLTVEGMAALKTSGAVFYHGSSDGVLVRHLLETTVGVAAPLPPVVVEAPPPTSAPPALQRAFHSGDLGDIIYSLPFLRALGTPIHLFIGPDPRAGARDLMTFAKFSWLAPLLVAQPYIARLEYCDLPPKVDYNLNAFRASWRSPESARRPEKRLYMAYFEHFGVKPLDGAFAPWLTCSASPDTLHPIVIARSPRYQNPTFPWKEISRRYSNRIIFLGLAAEHRAWCSTYSATAIHRDAIDALDMATIIKGAMLFVGNQSFPMSLALALGVNVIQETSPHHHDSILERPNAQFTDKSCEVRLPSVTPIRYVSRDLRPTRLGPFIGAPGIGDTLMVTPLARALGSDAVMCLPPSMERLAFLFHKLCPVEITDDPPYFPFQSGGLQSAELLKAFGFIDRDPLPSIEIARSDAKAARALLRDYAKPIAFCPTCAHHYSRVRQAPPTFWSPVVAHLVAQGYTVLQTGFASYPLLSGATRLPFVSLPVLAALYAQIGNYVGVHTGDHHLALATGCRAVIAEPVPWPEEKYWTYSSPRALYAKLTSPSSVITALSTL